MRGKPCQAPFHGGLLARGDLIAADLVGALGNADLGGGDGRVGCRLVAPGWRRRQNHHGRNNSARYFMNLHGRSVCLIASER